jgi:hypothetical protein
MHILDHGRTSRRFLLHRKCNLGLSTLRTRGGSLFGLAFRAHGLRPFIHQRHSMRSIEKTIRSAGATLASSTYRRSTANCQRAATV